MSEIGVVAPHEGREIELVLGGVKRIASIEHDKDPDVFVKAILMGLAGLLSYRVCPTLDCQAGEVVFCLPENQPFLKEYEWLRAHGVQVYGLKWYHRQMGRLFGYSEADVKAFIDANIECECTKCRGFGT